MSRTIALHFAAAWVLFLAASAAPRLLGLAGLGAWLESVPWLEHFIVKSVLLGLALAAMARDGRGWREFGFRRPETWRRKLLWAGVGLGLGASLLILATPARGMGVMFERFTLLAMVLSVWVYSSVTEEIFARGWFQGALAHRGEGDARSASAIVAASAVLFGSMHLSLLRVGADAWTVGIVVVATTLLGWAAAVARRQSGSLGPAILVHVLFNVGGFVAGVLFAIATIARTGKPPELP